MLIMAYHPRKPILLFFLVVTSVSLTKKLSPGLAIFVIYVDFLQWYHTHLSSTLSLTG